MRIVRILFVCISVVFSLLSFPAVLSWVLLIWLLVAARAILQNRSRTAVLCLAFAVFLAALRGPLCGSLFGFCLVCLALSILVSVQLPTAQETRSGRRSLVFVGLPILFLAFSLFTSDRWMAATASSHLKLNLAGSIVCLGDSLTSGLPSVGGYPPELQTLRQESVVDFGHEGITADEAIPMLADLKSISPKLVVVELGGHDFLKKQSRASTKADLLEIIDACEAVNADVILCEIPRGFIFDPFYGLEREIARERDLGLISDTMIRKLVLFSPFAPPGLWLPAGYRLSDDGLHPNAAGNKMLARTVDEYLETAAP